ncbi:hypothetical protein C7S18_23335 [Ahniella affigens]|uniref:2Fe-2S iron-sulfur cluster binding domain-containing protein n=1 Tax=Ahniella affigens TaxID=2021234 RepID=A0A2P1PYL4_9GAMM|nr:FAD-binding oxidoreductase [Ahniella affigens]AVP99928.1 hypothetical protein C7S18_23335 [Ahniella affigens]
MATVWYDANAITVGAGETVLEACLRQGVALQFSCRAGACHVCMMRAPGAQLPKASQAGLGDSLRAKGYFLPCKCRPEDDLKMFRPDPADIAFDAVLVERHVLSGDVLLLRFEPHCNLNVQPGQHIQVVHPSGTARPYSIASLPKHDYFLDLHVQYRPRGLVSAWLCTDVQPGDTVSMHAPSGELSLQGFAPDRPVLMVATGTGAAPLLALAHEALLASPRRRIQFVHGARRRDGLYLHDTLQALASAHDGFRYVPCLSAERVPDIAEGRVTAQFDRLDWAPGLVVAIAGRPDMVDSARDALRARGIPAAQIVVERFRRRWVEDGVPTANPELWAALAEGRLLQAALRVFYARVFADPLLSPYFRGVTQQRLIEKQYSFLKSLITGSRDYFGQRPRNAHHWMVISDDLFDYRLGLMRAALIEQGVQEPWLSHCHALEERFRADIVKAASVPRQIDGVALTVDGLAVTTLDSGTLCDHCEAIIEPGTEVRYHQRLGTVYCTNCSAASDAAIAAT